MINLNLCEPGDRLLTDKDTILTYMGPSGVPDYPHAIQYANGGYGTRLDNGYVYRNRRLPTDENVIDFQNLVVKARRYEVNNRMRVANIYVRRNYISLLKELGERAETGVLPQMENSCFHSLATILPPTPGVNYSLAEKMINDTALSLSKELIDRLDETVTAISESNILHWVSNDFILEAKEWQERVYTVFEKANKLLGEIHGY